MLTCDLPSTYSELHKSTLFTMGATLHIRPLSCTHPVQLERDIHGRTLCFPTLTHQQPLLYSPLLRVWLCSPSVTGLFHLVECPPGRSFNKCVARGQGTGWKENGTLEKTMDKWKSITDGERRVRMNIQEKGKTRNLRGDDFKNEVVNNVTYIQNSTQIRTRNVKWQQHNRSPWWTYSE